MSNELQNFKSISESESVIKNSENFVGMGLWNIGNELKYIRDNKTYKEKDYSSFEEYVEKELEYSRQHAYKFIAISENYNVASMRQIGHLGMTKLLELKKLDEPQRENFIKENPVDEMTTRELQQAIKAQKELKLEKEIAEEKARRLETDLKQKEGAVKGLAEENYNLKLELSKKPQPQIVEKPIKVIPEDYEEFKRKVAQLETEKKKLKEQNDKKSEELAALSRAEIQLKNKYKARYTLTSLIREINAGIAEFEVVMKTINDLGDENISSFISTCIETIDDAKEKLNAWNMNRGDGVINVKFKVD